MLRLATATALLAASLALPAQAQDALSFEDENNILYAATCSGLLWPEGAPIADAGDTLPDGALRFLDVSFLLDDAADAHPDLAKDILAQKQGAPVWLEETRVQEPEIAQNVLAECMVFLDTWLPGRTTL